MPLKIAVVGAGVCGLAATKALTAAGFAVTCYEQSDRLGGLWALDNPSGVAAAYRSLSTNTSKERTAFGDFPMPPEWPHYPRHDQILSYLEEYVDRFAFRDAIVFGTRVETAEPRAGGGWLLRLAGGEEVAFDALVVANGHHWSPRLPAPPIPGSFDGLTMHSRDFRDAEPFRGKRVAVVGMGNSAMDIAVDCSFIARKTFLAMRRGVHVIPKTWFGIPSDRIRRHPLLPFKVRQFLTRLLTRVSVGVQRTYGLPEPTHEVLTAHPTLSDDIFPRLRAGAVEPVPEIVELLGDRVRFAGGRIEALDAIVYCTGYDFLFPFLPAEVAAGLDTTIPLFRRMVPIGVPNLFFIGLASAVGSIFPLAESQSEWLVDILRGEYAPPDDTAMRADVAREHAATRRRYVASKGHVAQVDVDLYVASLERERAAGAKRTEAAPMLRSRP
ncbi:MAG: NAD(P)-binding domain-containing protein [Candidatus Eremiobacteraeota bacterium]|nr:NAD(P)-binding domain-containing protein [Candidatus Eremiobacteraeota bacterium]